MTIGIGACGVSYAGSGALRSQTVWSVSDTKQRSKSRRMTLMALFPACVGIQLIVAATIGLPMDIGVIVASGGKLLRIIATWRELLPTSEPPG